MKVDLVVFDGADELDIFGPLEVFRRSAALGADVTVRLCSLQPADWVSGAFGSRFSVDAQFKPGQADVVVVPGGGWVAHLDRGALAEVRRGELPRLLVEAAQNGAVMAGVCTGAMVLAHSGLIGTRPATTHHDALSDLALTGASVMEERVVDDGDLVTCGGVTSGIDLALWLVARYFGESLSDLVAEGLEYPWKAPSRPSARL